MGINRDSQGTQFVFKDKDGRDHSFFVQGADDSITPYLDHTDKFKGRPVRVYWFDKLTGDGRKVVRVEELKAEGEKKK